MIRRNTALHSILHLKCPYCHEGAFFVSHQYDLSRAGDIHDKCPECGGRFNIEPGFYYGAMYVSYAIGVAACVTVWVASLVLAPDLPLRVLIMLIAGTMLLGGPLFYALSKIIWAHLFLRKGSERH